MSNERKTLLTPKEFIDAFCKTPESVEPYYPEPMVSRIMDINLFYDIRDKKPEVLRKINFELIVVDSDLVKPFMYYRYNPKTNELEEIRKMTSKEALQQIKEFKIVREHQPVPHEIITPITKYYAEQISIIEKDLEVLEIIRKNIYEGGFGFYFKNNVLQCTEDYNKIKEWLDNDK